MAQTQTSAEPFAFDTERERQRGPRQATDFCLLTLSSYAGWEVAFESRFWNAIIYELKNANPPLRGGSGFA